MANHNLGGFFQRRRTKQTSHQSNHLLCRGNRATVEAVSFPPNPFHQIHIQHAEDFLKDNF